MNRKTIFQTELRLQNDLLEIKKNRMTTKMFNTQLSDIIKDEENEVFTINILICPVQTLNVSAYHVFLLLILVHGYFY